MMEGNRQDLSLKMDSKHFDLFLRETFSILIDNFDTDMLESMSKSMNSDQKPIIIDVLTHEILVIIENTDTYDTPIKKLLKDGLKYFTTHVD